MSSRKRNVDEGAATPSSTHVETQDESIGLERVLQTCEVCGKEFQTQRSMSQHQRLSHPEFYHAKNIPRVVRQGWSNEECVLVAWEELRLVEAGKAKGITTRIRVNADLCRVFPHRSMDSIKGLRKQGEYVALRSKLDCTNKEAPPADPLESPIRDHSVANRERKWTTPSPKDRKGPKIRWSSELLDEVARAEARLSLVGCRNMNVRLSALFPDITLEAVKGMRRLPKYKSRLATIIREE